MSGVNMLCFTASYVLALAAEIAGLWIRPLWRDLVVGVAALAGLIAHTWYLLRRVQEESVAPLSSHHDWYLSAAWLLAVAYFVCRCYRSRAAAGIFLLPLVLGLIGASAFASTLPLAGPHSPRFWSQAHGYFLSLGAVAVLLGLVSGIMYLLQSHRLKRKLPPGRDQLRLPSLEWLEQANSRALATAAASVGLGFVAGLIAQAQAPRGIELMRWTDPVVLSLGSMLLWLGISEGLRIVYPAARRGRKVAYLTLTAFAFLAMVLASFTLRDSLHQTVDRDAEFQPGESL